MPAAIRCSIVAMFLAATAALAVDREGEKSVNGEPECDAVEESITVEVVGRLRTGVVAIGGETTGTTITAKDITWELDFGKKAALRRAAEKFDGRLVRVEGSLRRKAGVEVRERWIVDVRNLKPAGNR